MKNDYKEIFKRETKKQLGLAFIYNGKITVQYHVLDGKTINGIKLTWFLDLSHAETIQALKSKSIKTLVEYAKNNHNPQTVTTDSESPLHTEVVGAIESVGDTLLDDCLDYPPGFLNNVKTTQKPRITQSAKDYLIDEMNHHRNNAMQTNSAFYESGLFSKAM
ncbi:hypothetical protein [Faucicola boevrei]|uniref:hypothetical protein n=1 Tax=Faucicola boevrei TaxID=346665 RepID=UPI000382AA40|nr:hypothetical protein [Moraxella boevrei]